MTHAQWKHHVARRLILAIVATVLLGAIGLIVGVAIGSQTDEKAGLFAAIVIWGLTPVMWLTVIIKCWATKPPKTQKTSTQVYLLDANERN